MATVLFPIVAGIGCTITILEDGSGYDPVSGRHYTPRQVEQKIYGVSCWGDTPCDTFVFENPRAEQNFWENTRRRLEQMSPDQRNAYESDLRVLFGRSFPGLPPGAGGGSDLPSTTTEGGHTGGGAKGGGGK